MNDINMARKWAETRASGNYVLNKGTKEAIKVIQSLPDEWFDAKKLREAIDEHLLSYPHGSIGHTVAEDLACKLQALLPAPSLPTLADMTPEEREACQFMQADLKVLGDTYRVVILNFANERADCMRTDGARATQRLEDVTPRPGLPKLEWPAQEPHLNEDSLSGMWVDDGSSPSEAIEFLLDKYEEHALPRPEDVPAEEAWLVKHDWYDWVGTRGSREEIGCAWALARLDGEDYTVAGDDEITLVSRLVPEATA